MRLNNILLQPLPNQTAKIEVTFDDKKQFFYLKFTYSEICGYWLMTIMDNLQNILLSNIPLVTGGGILEAGDLLAQFKYKNLGTMTIVKVLNVADDYPNAEELGNSFKLYWGDTKVTYFSEGTVGDVEEESGEAE